VLRLRRAARSSFSEAHCLENIAAVIAGAVERIPRKWANVQVSIDSRLRTPRTPQLTLDHLFSDIHRTMHARTQCFVSLFHCMTAHSYWAWQATKLCATVGGVVGGTQLIFTRSAAQALFLKTSDSVALPIYQTPPAAPQRIRVPKADAAAQPSAVAAEA